MRWITGLVDTRNPVTRQGWRFGLALGAVHIGYGLVNNLGNLDAAGTALLNNALAVALVVLFGLAGWRGAHATGRVSTGVQAGLLTWVVSSAIGIASLWIITFAFVETIRQNTFMLQDFARSGARDMDTFIVEDAIGATMFGSALMLAVGTACGTLGALIGKGTGRLGVRF